MFGREEKVSAIRLTAVQYVVLFIFLLLAYGLWRLQVMASGHYAQLAEQNYVRNVPILAPRGKILDREGRTIVDNYPSFSALLLRDSTRDLKADADAIARSRPPSLADRRGCRRRRTRSGHTSGDQRRCCCDGARSRLIRARTW